MVARRGTTKLGDVLACKKDYTPNQITVISLDGTPYLQTPGKATDRRAIALYCESEAMRIATDKASNEGAIITVEWRDGTLVGYIDGKVNWKEWKDEHGVGTFKLLVREVIST